MVLFERRRAATRCNRRADSALRLPQVDSRGWACSPADNNGATV